MSSGHSRGFISGMFIMLLAVLNLCLFFGLEGHEKNEVRRSS
jgi:hypothetical protein